MADDSRLKKPERAIAGVANTRSVAFYYEGADERLGSAYSLDAIRRHAIFGEVFVSALHKAGVEPESYLPEYGPRQYEVTYAPAAGVTSADRAVIVRELARAAAGIGTGDTRMRQKARQRNTSSAARRSSMLSDEPDVFRSLLVAKQPERAEPYVRPSPRAAPQRLPGGYGHGQQ